ncbi:MAG: D-glycero-beta-D-manno-heptose 1-phosphate adenylyltransferase [Ignavibacteriales bacterium CG_4_9_14_3_um_filter_30_11]|nr:MAG: D-glycero-beta-D-manno-heptose 1-phosphate adenylyltransferase [Ignavibacteriales bacterium CG_4_9_14_3_um_filter_30_11]
MTNNIKTLKEFLPIREKLKSSNKKVVFTNGCFDLIHAGHIDYLNKAKSLGDVLVVGINSDVSVSKIKGDKRPLISENERTLIVSNLKSVDYVIIFNEDTPEKLIEEIIPDILVKGADWDLEKIVGRDIVINNGGQVKSIDFVIHQSTSKIIDSILKRNNK